MRRCFVFLLSAMFIGTVANAQLVNNGATITVQSGATIKCTGAIINNSGGIIQNAGIVSSDGELRNEVGGTLTNNGTTGMYEATTKFVNYGNAFSAIKLKLIGSVNTDSLKSGAGSTYDSVILAKGSGFNVTLSDAMKVNIGIAFSNDNNKLILEDENLTMASAATFGSPDNNQFVVTNSTGVVSKLSLGSTAFVYPIGASASEFNPLTISNSGAADSISVRCLPNVLLNGLTGGVVGTDFVNNSWVLTEGTAGGSNLTLTGEWVTGDEANPSFNRVKSGIARYTSGIDWDLPASNVIAASGSSPYNRSRSNIQSVGVFAVADLDKVNAAKLSLKIFLQGANYNSGTLLMDDKLRDDAGTGPIDPVIPTTQPYNAALSTRFTRVGIYDGVAANETVNSSVFNTTGNDAIVDWVFISTLDPADPSIKLQTRAALLQRDGDIVDVDGVSPVSVPIDGDGNYHFLVGHRNHLSVRTPVVKSLADNTIFSYNFTTGQGQAYQNTITPPQNLQMKDLGGGAFGLWGGNVNANTQTKYGGSQNDPAVILQYFNALPAPPLGNAFPVYSTSDVNMDRRVKYGGSQNDTGPILLYLGSSPIAIFTEHL